MDYPKFIVSNQKGESIDIHTTYVYSSQRQQVTSTFSPGEEFS